MKHARIPALGRRRHRNTCAAMVLACATAGCAGSNPWKTPRMPWDTSEAAAKTAEKYGPTADQRIETLSARAKEAKQTGGAAALAFTEEIANTMLAEHDPRVRADILTIAAEFDTPAALAICRGAMEDPADRVRLLACDVWGRRGGGEAVKLLAHRYETDAEIDVRLRAVRRLGEVKDKTAIPVLAKALEDGDPAIQYRAVAALKQVTGRDLGDDVNKWRAWVADPESEPEWSIAEAFRRVF
jgi:HEAT repeat protein